MVWKREVTAVVSLTSKVNEAKRGVFGEVGMRYVSVSRSHPMGRTLWEESARVTALALTRNGEVDGGGASERRMSLDSHPHEVIQTALRLWGLRTESKPKANKHFRHVNSGV